MEVQLIFYRAGKPMGIRHAFPAAPVIPRVGELVDLSKVTEHGFTPADRMVRVTSVTHEIQPFHATTVWAVHLHCETYSA